VRRGRRLGRRALFPFRQRWWSQTEDELTAQSSDYWASDEDDVAGNSHWRGAGPFADDSAWLASGARHWQMFEKMRRTVDSHTLGTVLEWGCGGGMNAVHFAPQAQKYVGVDISAASLRECERQMLAEDAGELSGILIDPARPEAAVDRLGAGCVDLFLCTYVYELLPTPEYGVRLLDIAFELLAPGGMALIQIKYPGERLGDRSRRWNYRQNLAWNATHTVDQFWLAAEESGFEPQCVRLLPVDSVVSDRNYAYFFLVKPAAD
jgi:SAM-dependent methyltransferase